MAHAQIHVIKEVDGTIDPEFLKMAIKEFPACSGVAVALGGDNVMQVEVNRGPADLEVLMEAQTDYKDKKLYFTFGSHPEGFPDDEMQPWTLLKDPDNEDLVVCFIDGSFPSFAKADSSYSSAFHFAHDWLQGEVHKLYMEVEGDITEFMKRLNSASFKKEIMKNGDENTSITILTYDTPAITFKHSDNTLFGDYPDFWTSNSIDYDEELETRPEDAPEKKEAPVVPKRKSMLAKGSGDAPKVPVVTPAKPGDTAPVPPKNGEDKVLMRCPQNITKWKDVRTWYEQAIGTVPGNYKERPEVPVLKSRLQNAKSLQELGAKLNVASTTPVSTLPAKVPDPKPVTLPAAKTEPAPTSSEFFHIVPPEDIKKFFKDFAVRDDIKGAVDSAGKPTVLSPEELAKQEQRWSTFCEQAKVESLTQVVNWKDPALWVLVKEHPRYAFKLIKDLLRAHAIAQGLYQPASKPAEKAPVGVVPRKGKVAA